MYKIESKKDNVCVMADSLTGAIEQFFVCYNERRVPRFVSDITAARSALFSVLSVDETKRVEFYGYKKVRIEEYLTELSSLLTRVDVSRFNDASNKFLKLDVQALDLLNCDNVKWTGYIDKRVLCEFYENCFYWFVCKKTGKQSTDAREVFLDEQSANDCLREIENATDAPFPTSLLPDVGSFALTR